MKDYHVSVQRAEEDFQRQMRQLRAEHEGRLEDLIASRDVLGLRREMRSYERERSQATEEHAVEMSRMKADAADRLREMETQFAREKQRRMADYQQRLADQQEDFTRQQEQQKAAFQQRLAELETEKRKELQELKQKHAEQLRELDRQYAQEKQRRYRAFVEQLRDLDLFTGRLKQSWDKFYADMEAKLRDFIAKAEGMEPTTTTTTTPKQAGGYASFGRYTLGEAGREFVLSAPTTRKAERFVGGGLTQGGLIGALAGGGGLVIENLAITLPGTNMDEKQLSRFMQDKFPGYMAEALGKARGRLRID